MIEDLKDKKVLEWLNQNPKATKEQELEYRSFPEPDYRRLVFRATGNVKVL